MSRQHVDLSESEIDGVLMTAVAKGDHEALNALFERHAESIHTCLRRAGYDAEDARKAIHAVYSQLWTCAKKYKGEGHFRPYIFRIALGCAQDLAGCADVAQKPVEMALRETIPPIAQLTTQQWSDTEAVERGLAAATPLERMVYTLSEVGRLDYREISEAAEISVEEAASSKAGAVFAMIEAISKEHLGGENQPISISGKEACALSAYADGQLAADKYAEIENELDSAGSMMAVYEQITRLRQSVRALPAPLLSPAVYEELEQEIRLKARRRLATRLRLTFEMAFLALALIICAVVWFQNEPTRKDRVHTWLFRQGWVDSLPGAPQLRMGERIGWMLVENGKSRLNVNGDSSVEYLFSDSGALFSGDIVSLFGDEQAHIIFPDGSQIVAQGPARFALDKKGPAVSMRLDRGALWCSVFLLDDPILLATPNTSFAANGSDFSLRIESNAPKEASAPKIRRVRLVSDKEQEEPEEKLQKEFPALEGPYTSRIVVAQGKVEIGETMAIFGETLEVKADGKPQRAETAFRHPDIAWGEELKETAVFNAVDRLANLRLRVQSALEQEMLQYLNDAISNTDLSVLFRSFLDSKSTGEAWYRDQLKAQIADVAGMQFAGARRVAPERILLYIYTKDAPDARIPLLFEKTKKEDSNESYWKLIRCIGNFDRYCPSDDSQAPSDATETPVEVDDETAPGDEDNPEGIPKSPHSVDKRLVV